MNTFAHPSAALRVELLKLREQVLLRLLLALCLLAPIGFALVMRLQSTVPADTLFGRWAKASGFATSLTLLGFAGSLAIPLLAGVVAGDVFASEDRHGTWKTILTRGSTRADVFLGKTVAAAVLGLLTVAVLAASSLVSAVLIVGSQPLVALSGQVVSPGDAAWLVIASWASILLPTLAYVSLGLLLSAATRSGIVGVLGPALVGLAMQLLSLVGPGEIVRAVLLGTPFDAWHGLFVEPAHAGPLLQGALTSVAYVAVFVTATWLVLRRRAFAGDDAEPGRRRQLAVRAALAAAALVAVLVLASGVGPTEITSSRLQASISPTFERLVSLQYVRRTHSDPPADASVHVRTVCRRSNGSRSGPGDDWTCVVRVVHPQVKGAAVTLEVSVKANGCYTADAPAAIVGPLLLRDDRGRAFTNPLAAFDGCLGTA
jgi:ABC-2 type transport system permease protein